MQMDSFVNTLGEYYFGAGQGCNDLLYFSIGSGFSSGLILGGKLITGYKNMAGQCGFYSINGCNEAPNEKPNYVEETISGYGMVNLARKLIETEGYSSARFLTSQEITTQRIVLAAREEDPLALRVLAEITRVLGLVLSAYLAFVSPQRVVIGGGLGLAIYDLVVPSLRSELQHRVPEDYTRDLEILAGKVDCSAVGPACLVFHQQEPDRFSIV
jgi:glucokinase